MERTELHGCMKKETIYSTRLLPSWEIKTVDELVYVLIIVVCG